MSTATPKMVADMVTRARMGDQNAMGMLKATREAAMRGSKRAREAFESIRAYILLNPVKNPKDAIISGEDRKAIEALKAVVPSSDLDPERHAYICGLLVAIPQMCGERARNACCVVLANGALLVDPRVIGIGDGITDKGAQQAFFGAIDSDSIDPECPYAQAGAIVGAARSLQLVRMPNVSIGIIGAQTAYELL